MCSFFKKLQEVHNPPDITSAPELPANYPQLQKQYLHFCQSRDQNEEAMLQDLYALVHMPQIAQIAFVQNQRGLECLLGTTEVTITNPSTGRVHVIGEFLVQINRGQHSILFENITRGIPCIEGHIEKGHYQHPHIPYSKQICMTTGKPVLQEYISKGMLYDASKMIVRALWTLDQAPYGDATIDKWPLKE